MKDKKEVLMMKEYKVKLTITGEKEFTVLANNEQDAILKGVSIASSEPKFTIARNDIKSISGCLETPETDLVCNRESGCDDCVLYCPECGSCSLDMEDFTPKKECEDCIYLCKKCKSCTYAEDKDEYIDEELALRKELFKDFVLEVIDEILEYGEQLFEEE